MPFPPGPIDYPCYPGAAVPWCAPGTAPVLSPCGVFAGGFNASARDMLSLDNQPMATWTAGAVEQVAFAIVANHGGGYSYRLCPLDSALNEECFQNGHLKFSGDTQQILAPNGTVLAEVEARRLDSGTFPAGSQWTRNRTYEQATSARPHPQPQPQPQPGHYGIFTRRERACLAALWQHVDLLVWQHFDLLGVHGRDGVWCACVTRGQTHSRRHVSMLVSACGACCC